MILQTEQTIYHSYYLTNRHKRMPKFTFRDVQYVPIRNVRSVMINVIPLESNKRIPMPRCSLLRITTVKHIIKTEENQYEVKCDLYEDSLRFLVDRHILMPVEKKLKCFKSLMECDFISKIGKRRLWTKRMISAFKKKNTLIFSTLLNYRITKKFPGFKYANTEVPIYIEEILEDIDPHSLSYYGSNVVNAYIAYKCCYLAKKDLEGTKEIRRELLNTCLKSNNCTPFVYALFRIGNCPYIAYLLLTSAIVAENHSLEELIIKEYSLRNITYENY